MIQYFELYNGFILAILLHFNIFVEGAATLGRLKTNQTDQGHSS